MCTSIEQVSVRVMIHLGRYPCAPSCCVYLNILRGGASPSYGDIAHATISQHPSFWTIGRVDALMPTAKVVCSRRELLAMLLEMRVMSFGRTVTPSTRHLVYAPQFITIVIMT